jgi:hypothetical protein
MRDGNTYSGSHRPLDRSTLRISAQRLISSAEDKLISVRKEGDSSPRSNCSMY